MSDRPLPLPIIVACGMKAEAKLAAGEGLRAVVGGGDADALEATLETMASASRAFVSFGIAGGLAPALRPGACLVASAVVAPDGRSYPTHGMWSEGLASELGAGSLAIFAGVDAPLADVAEKAALRRATNASSVDMESHIVARVAARHGLPFAAVRVIADPADRQLPRAATVGMRRDGGVDLPAVLLSLARDPRQLPALIRTARDARAAFASLLGCRQLLRAHFGLPVDLGDPLFDMA